jgi:2-keto-4-pentenoate hydratase/2-oxohepta-3-ene-1,7-dioic acid hydratase in catechol pathway
MKIIRFQDRTGWIHYGALQPDGVARRIEGDIFGKYYVTQQQLQPARLLSPITPAAILCIGLNYRKHAAETKAPIPEFPILFLKNPAAVQNPNDPIQLPRHLVSGQVDYECELAVVIHKRCKNVSADQALDYVLGYTAANDVSARDWQRQWGGSQWCRGKSFDTFCPLGPAIVTPDEIPDPNQLEIKTELNGRIMQHSNTSDMIFSVPRLIEFLSGSTTLLPGTLILTGTPEGVGMARPEPVWLKAGDVVSVEIQSIGTLTNPVTEESLA